MDVNQSLNWKQVVIALVVLFGFNYFFTPIQIFVLSNPWVGVVLLLALVGGWLLYRKSKQKPGPA